MSDAREREALERLILEKVQHTYRLPNAECFNQADVDDYMAVWYRLVQYFRKSDDVLISLLTVREYQRSLDYFYQLSHYAGVDQACRSEAEEAAAQLRFYMDEIVEAVGSKTSRPGE